MRLRAVLILIALCCAATAALAYDRTGMASVGAGFGAASFSGNVPELTGPRSTRLILRGGTKFIINNHLRVTGSLGYGWNTYKGLVNPQTKQTVDTLLIVNPVELGLEYSYGPDYKASRPYAGVQLGMYRRQFVENQAFGVRHTVRDTLASRDIDKGYFGFGFNLGEEYLWRDDASVCVELGYHHISSNDADYALSPISSRFNGALNLLELRAGFNYYFAPFGTTRDRKTGASLRPDTVLNVQSSHRVEVQKETIQIVPEAVQGNPAGTPAPAPVTPTPAPPPAPAATPAPADTSHVKPAPDSAGAGAAPPAAQPSAAPGTANSPPTSVPPAPVPTPAAADTSAVKQK